MKANKQLLIAITCLTANMVTVNPALAADNADKKTAIIVAGQSNAEGRVPPAEFPVSYTNESGQTVNYLQTDGSISSTKYWAKNANNFTTWKLGTSNWAFDAIVLRRLQHLLNDVVYEIKWTQGGSAISPKGADTGGFWTAHFDEIPAGKNKYIENFVTNVKNAIAKEPNAFEIKAFLWHQGEGDYLAAPAADYYVNFRDLIAYVRTAIGYPNLPVIFGTISHKSSQYSAVVEAAQKRIADEDDNVYLIDMSDGALLDPYHFNATYSERLGKDAYEIIRDQILKLSSGTAPIQTDDLVVRTQYYNLLGVTVQQPQKGSIYIVKDIHQSGKATISKLAY